MQSDEATFICCSDTHGFHNTGKLQVPDGDFLIFAGDAGVDDGVDFDNFRAFLSSLPHKHKLVVWGNMDSYAAKMERTHGNAQNLQDALVLNGTSAEVGGFQVSGSPWTPKFYGQWQFESEAAAEAHWSQLIKPDSVIQVLITHGPPYGFGDLTKGRHVGDKHLMRAVQAMNDPPMLWVCGHIHESFGTHVIPHAKSGKNITLVNAALDYQRRGVAECQPITISLPRP